MFKQKKSRIDGQVPERTYSSIEVSDVAKVSLRQLQWWDERKVVSPRHEGHRRVYFTAEVIEITVIAELRRKGFSLQKIRRVLRFLQREMGRRLAKATAGVSEITELDRASPFEHVCTPEEVADVVAFLVSPKNGYVSGQVIYVDGAHTGMPVLDRTVS